MTPEARRSRAVSHVQPTPPPSALADEARRGRGRAGGRCRRGRGRAGHGRVGCSGLRGRGRLRAGYGGQLNTELSIPVEFSFGDWDIEVDYTFSFPNALPNEESLDQTGYFSVSLGYLIGL